MEITGKVVAVLELQSGTSKKGSEWKKRDFVIETLDEKFPKKVCFTLFGDRADACPSIASVVNVPFDIDAHEYNGRWFNNIRAFDVRPVAADPAVAAAMAPGVQPMPAGEAFPPAPESGAAAEGESTDDLPF